MHVGHQIVGFSLSKRGDITEAIIPEIDQLIKHFLSNEFFTIKNKFEKLVEVPIRNTEKFVKTICDSTKLFKFEKSEKNAEPSLNAQLVIDTIKAEAKELNDKPNLWIGYNAFNAILHGKLSKTFDAQRNIDQRLLEEIYSWTVPGAGKRKLVKA